MACFAGLRRCFRPEPGKAERGGAVVRSGSLVAVSATAGAAAAGQHHLTPHHEHRGCMCHSDTQRVATGFEDCNARKVGGRPAFHGPDGTVLVDKHKFPSGLGALVAYGHARNLTVSWYDERLCSLLGCAVTATALCVPGTATPAPAPRRTPTRTRPSPPSPKPSQAPSGPRSITSDPHDCC